MKKTIIGTVFMLSGIFVTMSILFLCVILSQNLGGWTGSKLLYVVSVNGIELPLTIGIILSFIGVSVLIIEYFSPSTQKHNKIYEPNSTHNT